MSHVQTNPDIFVPYETYVPVKWDLSDLEEKCRHYLSNAKEREDIASEAQRRLNGFFRDGGFRQSIAETEVSTWLLTIITVREAAWS